MHFGVALSCGLLLILRASFAHRIPRLSAENERGLVSGATSRILVESVESDVQRATNIALFIAPEGGGKSERLVAKNLKMPSIAKYAPFVDCLFAWNVPDDIAGQYLLTLTYDLVTLDAENRQTVVANRPVRTSQRIDVQPQTFVVYHDARRIPKKRLQPQPQRKRHRKRRAVRIAPKHPTGVAAATAKSAVVKRAARNEVALSMMANGMSSSSQKAVCAQVQRLLALGVAAVLLSPW